MPFATIEEAFDLPISRNQKGTGGINRSTTGNPAFQNNFRVSPGTGYMTQQQFLQSNYSNSPSVIPADRQRFNAGAAEGYVPRYGTQYAGYQMNNTAPAGISANPALTTAGPDTGILKGQNIVIDAAPAAKPGLISGITGWINGQSTGIVGGTKASDDACMEGFANPEHRIGCEGILEHLMKCRICSAQMSELYNNAILREYLLFAGTGVLVFLLLDLLVKMKRV